MPSTMLRALPDLHWQNLPHLAVLCRTMSGAFRARLSIAHCRALIYAKRRRKGRFLPSFIKQPIFYGCMSACAYVHDD